MARPSPVLLASILISILLAILALVWGFIRSGGDSGKPVGEPLPEPLSFAKPAPNGGKFVLVVLGNPESEAKLSGEAKRKVDDVRKNYPVSGLYPVGPAPAPLWTWTGYAPDENVFLSSDGRHVVRLEGDWWKTKAYPAGKRLPEELEQTQLAAPAISLFTDGQLTHQYRLNELVRNPSQLTHSPEHILWPGGAVLNEAEGKFFLFTQDSLRIVFDLETGKILSHEPVGLGSRFAQIVVTSVVGLMVVVALLWAYFALIRGRKSPVPVSPSVSPGA
jgi:hypothetical protein